MSQTLDGCAIVKAPIFMTAEEIDGRTIVVLIGVDRKPVEEIDAKTYQSTGVPKQFKATAKDGGVSLEPLPRSRWIDHPLHIAVDSFDIG